MEHVLQVTAWLVEGFSVRFNIILSGAQVSSWEGAVSSDVLAARFSGRVQPPASSKDRQIKNMAKWLEALFMGIFIIVDSGNISINRCSTPRVNDIY
jgi:hypothetical protein